MRAWLLAVGFVSVLGQVVLLRELAVASFGVELVYSLALGVWLLGGALGAAVLGRTGAGRGLWLLTAALLPLAVVFLRAARGLAGSVPGAYLPIGTQLAIAAIGLVPFAALLGALFPLAARSSHLGLPRAYALESAGGVLGGAASTGLLYLGVSNWAAALGCAAAALVVALVPLRPRPRWLLPTAALLSLALAATIGVSTRLDHATTAWNHPALAATLDTPYGRVTAESREGLVSVFDNDALAFDTEGTQAEEFVALAAIVVLPPPKRVLVLGGAASGLVEQALAHRPEVLDAFEQDEAWFRLVVPLLPEASQTALRAAQVHVRFGDPRGLLEDATERWDLIIVGAPEPSSAASNRFYTREFFALAAAHLAPGGVMALRLPTAENVWTEHLTAQTSAIERAMRTVFADVLAVPAGRLILLGAAEPLERNPTVLAERLRERSVPARAAVPPYVHYLFSNDRMAQVATTLAGAHAEPNSDLRPVCWRHAAVLWLERVAPSLARSAGAAGSSGWAWAPFALLGAALLGCSLLPRARPIGLVALAGFSGMLLEMALVLDYQTRSGVLFLNLGLLLMVFLAGLATGAWAAARLSARRPLALATMVVALAAVSGATGLLLQSGALGLGGTAVLLLLAGGVCGALFATASGDRFAASYAADLAGGCVAALGGSLLALPLLGLGTSALALAPLALLGLLLVR